MPMRELEEKKSARIRAHSISMENRERVSFTGVKDVESFNEEEVILHTEAGVIALEGQGLHISRLNLDDGQLIVEGYIIAMEYLEDTAAKRTGVFSRLFH